MKKRILLLSIMLLMPYEVFGETTKKIISSPNISSLNNNYFYIIVIGAILFGMILIKFCEYLIKRKHIKESGRQKLKIREVRRKELSYKRAYIASISMIIIGVLILAGKGLYIYLNHQGEEESLKNFYVKESSQKEETNDEESSIEEPGATNEKSSSSFTYDYIATLKIPKINFERGLVAKDSKYNDVSKNIEILDESDMPDVENGNLILAGHSGNSRVSFFRRLVEIDVGDEAIITYKGKTYTYKVVNSYDIPKTGMAEIIRNPDRTTLTLITCRQGTNNQVIYICELDNVK